MMVDTHLIKYALYLNFSGFEGKNYQIHKPKSLAYEVRGSVKTNMRFSKSRLF